MLIMSTGQPKARVLSGAQERYVEYIADAEAHHGHAHISTLAMELGIRKPSVVQMTAKLVDLGMVKRQAKEIVLTARGRAIASELDGRHTVLEAFMKERLGMSAKAASREACRLEHVVSPGFMSGLRDYIKKKGRGGSI